MWSVQNLYPAFAETLTAAIASIVYSGRLLFPSTIKRKLSRMDNTFDVMLRLNTKNNRFLRDKILNLAHDKCSA